MTAYEHDTMTTTVPDEASPQHRGEKLVDRQAWLDASGRSGWKLASTITLPGDRVTYIVDTTEREKD
jgi:hypothetical protein